MTLREFIEATKDLPLDANLTIKTADMVILRVESVDYYKHQNTILISDDKERTKGLHRTQRDT